MAKKCRSEYPLSSNDCQKTLKIGRILAQFSIVVPSESPMHGARNLVYMKTKKIVFTLHMLGQAGTERVACILASGFAKAGYDTTMIIFSDNGGAAKAMSELLDKRVNKIVLGQGSGSRSKDLIRFLPKCSACLKQIRPDFVMSTGNHMNLITAIATQRSGIETKLILKATNPIIHKQHRGIKGAARKLGYHLAFHRADMVLTLSDAERKQLLLSFPRIEDKVRKAINPYVTPAMLQASNYVPSSVETKIVLGVGRFQKQKRFDRLIRAFALVKDSAAKLVILGDGTERPACVELIEELGIAHRVFLPGFVTDVASWYKRASVFVLSSDYEGLPAVILEALAGNCPVLSTDCFPAVHDILEPLDHCKIIAPPSPENIAEHIDTILGKQTVGNLAHAANEYSIESGIASHIKSVASFG
ncbi:glycosyltransferase [Sphingorhabdus sp. EL138]|uniref:glycosyltransferase n=1 Tax=Sphingorhabdus sp. EL138 TaxID=2073156 RepID=UPI0013A58A6A|nr:glycosyltransferase [Sphingorhabdus sp. EL138]